MVSLWTSCLDADMIISSQAAQHVACASTFTRVLKVVLQLMQTELNAMHSRLRLAHNDPLVPPAAKWLVLVSSSLQWNALMSGTFTKTQNRHGPRPG